MFQIDRCSSEVLGLAKSSHADRCVERTRRKSKPLDRTKEKECNRWKALELRPGVACVPIPEQENQARVFADHDVSRPCWQFRRNMLNSDVIGSKASNHFYFAQYFGISVFGISVFQYTILAGPRKRFQFTFSLVRDYLYLSHQVPPLQAPL